MKHILRVVMKLFQTQEKFHFRLCFGVSRSQPDFLQLSQQIYVYFLTVRFSAKMAHWPPRSALGNSNKIRLWQLLGRDGPLLSVPPS